MPVSGRLCASEKPGYVDAKSVYAMARLARPGGTLATFTSAGLSAVVYRKPDSRCKNVRALGQTGNALWGDGASITPPLLHAWFNRTGSSKREVAIIGGGIAARCCRWRYYVAAGR